VSLPAFLGESKVQFVILLDRIVTRGENVSRYPGQMKERLTDQTIDITTPPDSPTRCLPHDIHSRPPSEMAIFKRKNKDKQAERPLGPDGKPEKVRFSKRPASECG
jgi:hypothetical protein